MNEFRILIKRFLDDTRQTLGKGQVIQTIEYIDVPQFSFVTIELPWKNNQQGISCIPVGKYKAKKFISPTHNLCFLVLDVPNRDMIEIHSANFSRQLKGCIAPGINHFDVDKDGLKDVTSSKITMERLIELMPSEFELEITSES